MDSMSDTVAAGQEVAGPDTIDNLLAWWKPETLVAVGHGNAIATWEDSKNANDAVAQEAASATYDTAVALNGHGAANFPNNAALNVATINTSTLVPCTIAAVIRVANLAADNTIFGGNTNGCVQFRVSSAGKLQLIHQSVALIGADTTTLTVNTNYFVVATYSAAGVWAFYIDGVAGATGTSLITPAAGAAILGGREGLTEDFIGRIWEAMVYSRALLAAEVAVLQTYVTDKFGLGS